MLFDDLLKLREGGSSPRITATEAGSVSLTRDATTGKVVIPINKTPAKGLAIVAINDADTGTSTDKVLTLTIEASDALASGWATVATFPVYTHGAIAANLVVRRIATQKKYVRSVITLAGTNGTISMDLIILVANQVMEED